MNIPPKKSLGFGWTLAKENKWFVFSVLPFGSASAPYVFTMSNTEGPSLTPEGTGYLYFHLLG